MSETPSLYDLTQDALIGPMRDILLTAAEPPSGPEFSYPVVDQAVSSSMWKWITRGQGDGIIEVGGWPYRLTGLDNATNTATLKVSSLTGTANAVVAGFFHQLSEDLPISLPMPSSGTTTYYICLTHDPREEGTASGPVSVQTYSGTPPATFGRTHVVLHTVLRTANQLLTDAVVESFRPRVAPTMLVARESQLGDPSQRLWGTLAMAHETSEWFMAMGSSSDSGGPTSWRNLTSPEWTESTSNAFVWVGHGHRPSWRAVGDRVELKGRVKRSNNAAFNVETPYTLIPNCPDAFGSIQMNAGSTGNGRTVLMNTGSEKPVFEPSATTSWIDLAGFFYYVR